MRFLKQLSFTLCLIFVSPVQAITTDELIMIRSSQSFPETMAVLQEAIKKQGYKLSRVQRVDIGLTQMGYKTDKYRVVFFGKTEEIHHLTKNYPSLIPYLPLKIAIFAEGDETILVSSNPLSFKELYPDAQLSPLFENWSKDITKIFDFVQFPD